MVGSGIDARDLQKPHLVREALLAVACHRAVDWAACETGFAGTLVFLSSGTSVYPSQQPPQDQVLRNIASPHFDVVIKGDETPASVARLQLSLSPNTPHPSVGTTNWRDSKMA
jgi:hypothetical protein